MILKQYKKYIAEGKNIMYVSTVVAIILRCGALFSFDGGEINQQSYDYSLGWLLLAPFFSNIYISAVCGFLFSLVIAALCLSLNNKFNIIRRRTYLPYAFIIFLPACFPQLVFLSPLYLCFPFVLAAIGILYESYQSSDVAYNSFRISFMLAIASLFCPDIVFYIPLFWIGFFYMRSFNLKVIFASLLGLVMIYWPLACLIFFWKTELIQPIVYWYNSWENVHFIEGIQSSIKISEFIIYTSASVVVICIMIYNYINSFKDKIQTRAYLSFFNLLLVFSIVFSPILLLSMGISFMILLVLSGFIYSHYFALTEQKFGFYFFVGILLFYLTIYLYYNN